LRWRRVHRNRAAQADQAWSRIGIIVWRDGHEVVISTLNYEGPPKVFWEYRSLTGPFFKRNLRNGFLLWVAPRGDFSAPAAFTSALRSEPLRDETEGTVRRIEWGEEPGNLVLEYDLGELR